MNSNSLSDAISDDRGSNTALFDGFPEANLKPIVSRAWNVSMRTVRVPHNWAVHGIAWESLQCMVGGLNSPVLTAFLSHIYLPDFVDRKREKACGFEDLVKTQKGVCAQYKHNNKCGCVCFCAWISAPVWSPPLHSGNYFHQGLDEGEGKEEREKWRGVRAEKRGSRFRERKDKQEEKCRGEKRLRSALQSVCLCYTRRLWTLSKHELKDNSSNTGKITGPENAAISGLHKALWIFRDHHELWTFTIRLRHVFYRQVNHCWSKHIR